MSEQPIAISQLNDFVFCPVSIYFHQLYYDTETTLYQSKPQIDGKKAHETVDMKKYSTSEEILQSVDVYCEKYNLIGKIDIFNKTTGTLTERKKLVKTVYDGYIWQLYAQYFSMTEFDEYCGVLHTQFYMRKSLICDIVEPFRVIIDRQTKKSVNLGQFKEKDFEIFDGKWCLKYEKSSEYSSVFLKAIMEYKEDIFLYIRDFYRSFMKGRIDVDFPVWRWE